ncbi:MAG: hypothetical protein CBB72_016160 [Muricauda sp. TMED12]|nr:MAG: hypothetical protein CBB72_016160 [Muricauda sp. TMED12]
MAISAQLQSTDEATLLEGMKSFSDIISFGNAAASAGQPLVENWSQMRGALLMFERASSDIEQLTEATFTAMFPKDFVALDPTKKTLFPNSRAYNMARSQVWRLLACIGHIDDPWEELRMMIRRAGRQAEIELHWGALKTAALKDGLAPSEIRSAWVWSLPAEAKGGHPRQSLRRAVTVFNRMFDIPDASASGLLPPCKISAPTVHDCRGRAPVQLPNKLLIYQENAEINTGNALSLVWRAIDSAGTFNLPEDPSADDILAPDVWSNIKDLPRRVTGVADTTWCQYLTRAKRILLRHATRPRPIRQTPVAS